MAMLVLGRVFELYSERTGCYSTKGFAKGQYEMLNSENCPFGSTAHNGSC